MWKFLSDTRWVQLAVLIGALSAMLTFAQSTREPSPSLRVDVDLVLVNVTVTDASNNTVSGLSQEDFQVWEDKIEQKIDYFSSENVPVSVGIIFDISGSMADKLSVARAAATTFMRLGDTDDEYFLVQFSDSPRLIQDFTTDISKLRNRLLHTQAKGQTAMYDALYLGLAKVKRGSNSRKALLVITDGEDNQSRYRFSDLKEFAKENDVLIYGVGLLHDSTLPMSDIGGRGVLAGLAHLTGGAAYFPEYLESLPSICARIGMDLKNQYVLGYRPLNVAKDGKWRKIKVKINRPKGTPQLNVRAKSGYYASTTANVMK
jgi:Ca-activated chloride channel family protein